MATSIPTRILAEADQEIAEVTARLADLTATYRDMKAEGKDRTECIAVVLAGIVRAGDFARTAAILAVAVAELADSQGREVG